MFSFVSNASGLLAGRIHDPEGMISTDFGDPLLWPCITNGLIYLAFS